MEGMNLKEKIREDLKVTMKSGDAVYRDVLRFLENDIKKEEIDTGARESGLPDERVIAIVSRQIKQRRDSVAQFRNAKRDDLADKEEKEIHILEKYLPEQLSEDAIRMLVEEAIKQLDGADMGSVMGVLMPKIKGKADGALVRKIVEGLLQ